MIGSDDVAVARDQVDLESVVHAHVQLARDDVRDVVAGRLRITDCPTYDQSMGARRVRRGHSGLRRMAAAGLATAALTVSLSGSAAFAASKRAPLPAGPHPSEIAKEPCQKDAQHELATVLGVKGVVGPETWVDHRYSCPYHYPNGNFVLSIQELSSWKQTFAYYRELGHFLGRVRGLANLGQGAFQTTDGSVVVRKDWKVLLVNVAGLPAEFAVPPDSPKDIAVTVADVILGCWAGD
jgi:hypothetical protein